jgi:hypothetical protein
MDPQARDSKDRFDDLTLPRFTDYLELVFPHLEFFYPSFSRDVISTAAEHTWTFSVESSPESAGTELTWDPSAFGSGDAMLFLLDVQNCQIVNMKENSSYAFTSRGRNEFQIYYSRTPKENVQFDATVAGSPYPNPFASTARIPFVLGGTASVHPVELSIFDLSERKVRTLEAGLRPTGYHVLSWDGNDDGGNILPSGIYMYRMMIDQKLFFGRVVIAR